MSDPTSNPYAPPASGDPAGDFGVTWQLDGVDLRAKNGVTLPMVDLHSGVREEDMKTLTHTVRLVTADALISLCTVVGIFVFVRYFFQFENFIGLFVLSFIVLTILKSIGILRKNPNAEIRVFSHVDGSRFKRTGLRRRIRVILLILLVLMMLLPIIFAAGSMGSFGDWMTWAYPATVLGLIALGIWNVVDKTRPAATADQPGWLRFRNIHPDALTYLREREAEHLESIRITPPGRSRLVRTSYYHRYPLRMLLGKRIFNPLALIQIALMKWSRSPLLVRKTYHYSETEKLPLEALSTSLRKQADAWMERHEDWTFISGDRLPSPLGDITVDTVILAAPGLEHCACFHYVWSPLKPYAGTVSVKFLSFSINGTNIWTQDHPHLNLHLPNVEEHRATGNPEQVFQAHLRNCEGHMLRGPGSADELLRRIENEKEITDRILTERGYQDEARQST
jgi:hypothetical protein